MLQRLSISRIVPGNDGIALVTSLMLTLISLGVIMSVMYLITSGIQRAGASKRYKIAIEASYGGAELITKDLFPFILQNSGDSELINTLQTTYAGVNLAVGSTQQCLQVKLTSPTKNWQSTCNTSINPKKAPDVTFTLPGENNQSFTIYAKIVDTVAGNTDMGGLQLGGAGVAESQGVLSPQHYPYLYRIEVEAERSSNAYEKSTISVLYAY